MLSVVRETFKERYEKYLADPNTAKQYLKARLSYISPEELAYLLAVHDKFYRIGCQEYENEPSGLDPLGRKVDCWGRVIHD